MEGKQEKDEFTNKKNGKSKALADTETKNQASTEIVVLDSEDGAPTRTGDATSVTCSSYAFGSLPPFLQKLCAIVENEATNLIVSWSSSGTSFIVWDPHSFAANTLPQYFKHCNFQSFVSQLNSYGFKKVRYEQWEFQNEYFRRGERHLLNNIKRRNQIPKRMEPGSETEPSGLDASKRHKMEKELEMLKMEHDLLKVEITKMLEHQEILEEKIVSHKNHAMRNEKQRILQSQIELSDTTRSKPVDEDCKSKKILKGKRKPDLKSAMAQSNEQPIFSDDDDDSILVENLMELIPEQLTHMGKMGLDEEETGKCQSSSSTNFTLEWLIGESSDWIECIREMQGKASSSKS